jgi:hypothetical protein
MTGLESVTMKSSVGAPARTKSSQDFERRSAVG